MRSIDSAFIAPDTDQFLQRRAQQIGIGIAGAIIGVGNEHETRIMQQAIMALPIAAEGARHGDIGFEFIVDKAFDIGIAGVGKAAGEVAGGARRQDDRAGQRAFVGGETGEHCIHRDMIVAGEMRNGDAAGITQLGSRIFSRRLGVKTDQHFGAAIGLHLRQRNRVVDLAAGADQHAQPAAIDRSHRRPRDIGGARFLPHRHAVRHFEIMAAEGA